MKPAPFAFARPTSLEETLAILAGAANDRGNHAADAKVLAGGQSLVPLLTMRLASPAMLVDINAVPGLDAISCDASGVRIGALVRHSALLADRAAARTQPLVPLALSHVAHPTIRNRGTAVGSLVHADAAAEMPAVLALLGGSVDVVSVRGARTIPAKDLVVGPLESSLAHDEVAVAAFFPALAPGCGVAFAEIARRHGDYAMCGVAAHVADGFAHAAYLSVEEVPTVLDLSGVPLEEVGEAALAQLDPQPDIHATAVYRGQLVRVLTERVLRAAYDDARERAVA